MTRYSTAIALLAFATPAVAQDPLTPKSNASDALVSPLAGVTIGTSDLAATEAFYGTAMGMRCTRAELLDAAARAFRARYAMAPGARVDMTTCRRDDPGVAAVRAVLLPTTTPVARPGYDARLTGPLSLGFPSANNAALDRRVTALGVTSTAGLTSMTLPRGDGTNYSVGEVHYRAPDNVYALGIDRGTMAAVGTIDSRIGVGGPAYAGLVVGDTAKAAVLFGDVLGFEKRRATQFTSSGPTGGLGLPTGTRFDFQQWFAPGATSGYLIVMRMVDNARPSLGRHGLTARGIASWQFTTRNFDTVVARARTAKVTIVGAPAPSPWPDEGGRRSVVFATDDGFRVEVVEAPSLPAPAAMAPTLDPDRCDGKPVIMVVAGVLKDRARLGAYAKAIRDSGLYDVLGGYYMNSPRAVATFEGSPPPQSSTLMVRFPCLAHARTFWYSTKYQREIVPLRQNPSAGDFTVTVYPEIAAPAYMSGRLQPGGYAATPGPEVAKSVPQIATKP